MNREEIQKLLSFILNNLRLSDQDIIALIYDLVDRIEMSCYGNIDDVIKERYDRLYKQLFSGIFSDLISGYDYLDKEINNSLNIRNKQIVDKEKQ